MKMRACQPAEKRAAASAPSLGSSPKVEKQWAFPGATRQTKEEPCFLQDVRGPCQGTRVPNNSPSWQTTPRESAHNLVAAWLVKAVCAKRGKKKHCFPLKKIINFVIFHTFANYSSAFLMKVLCWVLGDQGSFC